MATRLGPLGIVGKWVIVPVALALVGYYVIGPRIGRPADRHDNSKTADSTAPTAHPGSTASIAPTSVTAVSSPGTSAAQSDAPDVDISARPVRGRDDRVALVHHKTRRRVHPKVKPKSDDGDLPVKKTDTGVPPPDEGGSAGATTAG